MGGKQLTSDSLLLILLLLFLQPLEGTVRVQVVGELGECEGAGGRGAG